LLVPNFKLFRETVYLIVVGILGLMYHNLIGLVIDKLTFIVA
jgi:hypothetical protein